MELLNYEERISQSAQIMRKQLLALRLGASVMCVFASEIFQDY